MFFIDLLWNDENGFLNVLCLWNTYNTAVCNGCDYSSGTAHSSSKIITIKKMKFRL